jgi:hypothetical protein
MMLGVPVRNDWTSLGSLPNAAKRCADRTEVTFPARLTWKDQRGTTRFASVVARNVSETGIYVESQSPVSLSLYRLVHFQLERDVRHAAELPAALRDGRALSAVYRVVPPAYSGARHGLALRLMVDPKRMRRPEAAEPSLASA